MAITKIHPIKSTLKLAFEYILNPEKTEDKMLVSSFGGGKELRQSYKSLQSKKDFIIKTIIPILFAIFLYSMFINLCTDSAGTVDYVKLFILCGIPFGITRLIVFSLFGLNGMLATLIFSFFIGGVIGGIILIWRPLVALYYIPLTAVRFVAAR